MEEEYGSQPSLPDIEESEEEKAIRQTERREEAARLWAQERVNVGRKRKVWPLPPARSQQETMPYEGGHLECSDIVMFFCCLFFRTICNNFQPLLAIHVSQSSDCIISLIQKI